MKPCKDCDYCETKSFEAGFDADVCTGWHGRTQIIGDTDSRPDWCPIANQRGRFYKGDGDAVLFVLPKGIGTPHMVRSHIGGRTLCRKVELESFYLGGFQVLDPRETRPGDVCMDCWIAWLTRKEEKALDVEKEPQAAFVEIE